MAELIGPVNDLLSTLSSSETHYYESRFKALFEQADSDPVLEPTIRDIILNEIFIARYQKNVQDMLANDNPNMGIIDKMHKLINSLQEKNLDALDSLNLTKAKKDALNKSPETTPSRLITGFALAVSTMTSAEREKNKKDIEEAMNRLRNNTETLLDLVPSVIGEDDLDLSE